MGAYNGREFSPQEPTKEISWFKGIGLWTTSEVSISKCRFFRSFPRFFSSSDRIPSRKRSCFYFALGTWIFRYAGLSRWLPVSLSLSFSPCSNSSLSLLFRYLSFSTSSFPHPFLCMKSATRYTAATTRQARPLSLSIFQLFISVT